LALRFTPGGIPAAIAGSLAAAVARVIRHRDPAPALAEALDKLADGLIELAGCLAGEGSAEHCRESLVEVAAHIDTDASSTPGLLVAWSQLESMVLHLLVASGLPEEEAHRLLGSKMEADPSPDRRELLARLV